MRTKAIDAVLNAVGLRLRFSYADGREAHPDAVGLARKGRRRKARRRAAPARKVVEAAAMATATPTPGGTAIDVSVIDGRPVPNRIIFSDEAGNAEVWEGGPR